MITLQVMQNGQNGNSVATVLRLVRSVKGIVAQVAWTATGATAEAARQRLIDLAVAETGLRSEVLQARISIKQVATPTGTVARIRPSVAGIPVPDYLGWSFEPTGRGSTRNRILIHWVGGRMKIVAGFVNPYGRFQAPLTTRLKRYPLAIALAPSAAALFNALFSSDELKKTALAFEQTARTQMQAALDTEIAHD